MGRHLSFFLEEWELTASALVVIIGFLLGVGLSEKYGLEFSQAVPVFAPLLTVEIFVVNFVIIGAVIAGGFALSIPSLFMVFTQSVGAGIAIHFVRAHLLFEVAALVLALAAAFKITVGEWRYFKEKRRPFGKVVIGRKVKIYTALAIMFLFWGALLECLGGTI